MPRPLPNLQWLKCSCGQQGAAPYLKRVTNFSPFRTLIGCRWSVISQAPYCSSYAEIDFFWWIFHHSLGNKNGHMHGYRTSHAKWQSVKLYRFPCDAKLRKVYHQDVWKTNENSCYVTYNNRKHTFFEWNHSFIFLWTLGPWLHDCIF